MNIQPLDAAHESLRASVDTNDAALRAKIARRILPFLFICYVVSFIDRINIGFAKLQMQQAIGLSEAAFGLAAGLFFVGYLVFEVPSNIMLARSGARLTMTRIMVLWGLVTIGTGFVRNESDFIWARFLLGVFEAGFYPGMILYLTFWIPPHERAKALASLITATAVAGLVGGPLSSLIMQRMEGLGALHGWQWMFIVEGAAAVLLGLMAFWYLDDKPRDAQWLTEDERRRTERDAAERTGVHASRASAWAGVLKPKVFLLSFCCFTIMCGAYALSFWIPSIIRAAGVSDVLHVGLLSAIPYAVGVVCMILISRHSDRKLERRWHFAMCAAVGGAAMMLLPSVQDNLNASIVILSIAVGTIFCGSPIFWTMPTSILPKESAPVGLALINSLAITGGMVGPYITGWSKTATGSFGAALYVIGGLLFCGALAALLFITPAELGTAKGEYA